MSSETATVDQGHNLFAELRDELVPLPSAVFEVEDERGLGLDLRRCTFSEFAN